MNHGDTPGPNASEGGSWKSIRRGVWIGLPLVAVSSASVAYGEIRVGAELVNSSLLVPSVTILLALTIISALLGRRGSHWALTRQELLTVYILLIVSLPINGKGMIEMLIPTIAAARFYAERHGWTAISDALPEWWQPSTRHLLGFFSGGARVPVGDWLRPFATWSLFLFVLATMTFCLCVLLRQQWIHRERLVFPMTVLPLELTRPGGLIAQRSMWIAFGIALSIESLNSLHQWYPAMPHVPVKAAELDISGAFTTPPWDALKGWQISFYPFAIGIAFLLTTEVSLSCWLFYLLVTKIEVVAAHEMGRPGRYPFVGEQGAGAYFGFALLVLWIARKPIFAAVDRLFGGSSGRPRPGRLELAAGIGFVVCLVVLVGFCVLGGSQWGVTVLFWVVTLAFLVTLTRARVEGGTVWALGPDTAASLEVLRITGTASLPPGSLMLMAVMQFFTNDWRALLMPNQLESIQMADSAGISLRRLLKPLAAATLLGILVAFWSSLAVWYHFGCASARVDPWAFDWGRVPWFFARSWHNNPQPRDVEGLWAVLVGALTVFALALARTRFLWWPLHPIGYVLGSSGDLAAVWFCFFLGWLLKSLALRYGGRRMFTRMLPFFLGLILGDYTAAAVWSIVGLVFNVPAYKVFP